MSDQHNALWGDGPALPKLPVPKSRLELKLEARDTPAGRAYELRLFRAELTVFLVGFLSIIFGAVWLLVVVAAGLVVIGALSAIDRLAWAQTELFACVASASALVFVAYWLRELGLGTDQTASLLTFTAPSILVTAATGVIFCHAFVAFNAAAGIAAQLLERREGRPF